MDSSGSRKLEVPCQWLPVVASSSIDEMCVVGQGRSASQLLSLFKGERATAQIHPSQHNRDEGSRHKYFGAGSSVDGDRGIT